MSKSPIKKLSAATVAGTVAFATLAAPTASAVEMTYKDGVCTYVFNQEEMSIPVCKLGMEQTLQQELRKAFQDSFRFVMNDSNF